MVHLKRSVQSGPQLLSIGRNRRIRSLDHDDRPAVVETPDTVQLPAPDEAVNYGIQAPAKTLAPANGQGIHIAELQDLGNVEHRQGSFSLQLIRILHGNRI